MPRSELNVYKTNESRGTVEDGDQSRKREVEVEVEGQPLHPAGVNTLLRLPLSAQTIIPSAS